MFSAKTDRLPERITFWDLALFVFLVILSLSPFILPRSSTGDSKEYVEVVSASGLTKKLFLDRDGLYGFDGPLGRSLIEIAEGRVRMKSSPCPHQICVRSSWKERSGQMIICAPNRIGVFIKNGEPGETDAVTR